MFGNHNLHCLLIPPRTGCCGLSCIQLRRGALFHQINKRIHTGTWWYSAEYHRLFQSSFMLKLVSHGYSELHQEAVINRLRMGLIMKNPVLGRWIVGENRILCYLWPLRVRNLPSTRINAITLQSQTIPHLTNWARYVIINQGKRRVSRYTSTCWCAHLTIHPRSRQGRGMDGHTASPCC